jgi:hypothetical protein
MPTTSAKSIEVLKHRFARDLEERKWQFKTLELQYLEAGQHLRSLNQLESPRVSWRPVGLSQTGIAA